MNQAPENILLQKAVSESLKETILRLVGHSQETLSMPYGLNLARRNTVSMSNHCFEEPMAGITLQGRKIIRVGQSEICLTAGTLLVTCVDAPSVSTVIESSPAHPYLSAYIRLDRQIMADLLLNANLPQAACNYEKYWTEQADLEIVDAFRRFVCALEKGNDDLHVKMIVCELHYLILNAPQSGLLRQLYSAGGRDSRISAVIIWMRANLHLPVSMEFLANIAHMSVSTFHRHFKQITGISPLQYHKQLRLYEAQRLMLAENQHASEAALSVGYESVTQFNREYRRLFGDPPGRDIAKRRKKFNLLDPALQAT